MGQLPNVDQPSRGAQPSGGDQPSGTVTIISGNPSGPRRRQQIVALLLETQQPVTPSGMEEPDDRAQPSGGSRPSRGNQPSLGSPPSEGSRLEPRTDFDGYVTGSYKEGGEDSYYR